MPRELGAPVASRHHLAEGVRARVRRRAHARRDPRNATARLALVTACTLALGLLVVGTWATGASSGTGSRSASVGKPRVLRVHPSTVRGRGGTKILILGRRFTSGTVITVGGVRARVLSVRNSGALVAVVPSGIGAEVVRATTSGGTSAANSRSVLRFDTRVLVVGDSLGIDLGWGFTAALDAQAALSVTDDAVGSSGLVRTDFYSWPAHLRLDIAETHPDVVMTLFGANDQQALGSSKGRSEPESRAWDRIYAARVRQLGAIVHNARATLVWVGLPRMGPQSSLNSQFVAHMVALDRSAVATIRGAAFVDSWSVFSTAVGAYTPYVEISPGVWVLGHAQDDTHLTPAGAMVIDAKGVRELRSLLTRR